jgi:ankyrin repeat protein
MNSKSLPQNPSLEFDKKSAKKLLDQAREGDAAALQRFRSHHPRFAAVAQSPQLALHDAQLVVAREYGFASWPRWKDFVASRRLDTSQRAAELVRAACSGDMRKASTLLRAEPELARFDLATAIACGETEHVGELLARDPTLAKSKLGPSGWEPLVYACYSRFLRSDRERAAGIVRCARLLLESGADPNAAHFIDGQGADARPELQTCLYGAAGIANNAELTRLLLEHGASVQADDHEVLYHAAEFRDVTCLSLVLAACPAAPAWRGPVPASGASGDGMVSYCLGRALDFENEAAALLFLQHDADPNQRVPWHGGRSHLHKAAMQGCSIATVSAMLDHGGDFDAPDDHGISPYRYAVRFGHHELVDLFESRGARADSVSEAERKLSAVLRGETGFRLEGMELNAILSHAARHNDVLSLQRLLDAGADVNAPGQMPPLHSACWAGQLDAARLLVERGASLTLPNGYGGDPLSTALHGSENCFDPVGGPMMKLREEIEPRHYVEIVELLLDAGANPPEHAWGSDAVQEALRRRGITDAD